MNEIAAVVLFLANLFENKLIDIYFQSNRTLDTGAPEREGQVIQYPVPLHG